MISWEQGFVSGTAEWANESQVEDVLGKLNTWFPSCLPLERPAVPLGPGGDGGGFGCQEILQPVCGEMSP